MPLIQNLYSYFYLPATSLLFSGQYAFYREVRYPYVMRLVHTVVRVAATTTPPHTWHTSTDPPPTPPTHHTQASRGATLTRAATPSAPSSVARPVSSADTVPSSCTTRCAVTAATAPATPRYCQSAVNLVDSRTSGFLLCDPISQLSTSSRFFFLGGGGVDPDKSINSKRFC